MNFTRTLGALVVTSLGTLAACSGTGEESETAEGAATSNTIKVDGAPVELCGKGGEDEGCLPCPEIIGDAADAEREKDKPEKPNNNVTYHRVQDREACTLKVLRQGIRDRIGTIISKANREGFFVPPGTRDADSKIVVSKITIKPPLAGTRTADFQAKRIGGSFTMGDDGEASSISGGLSVFTAYMPVGLIFFFEDKDNPGVQEQFAMQGEYGLVPYFFMKSSLDANLNLGSILSKFGPTSAVGGSLLAALGGNASLQLNRSETKMWREPRCAEASLGAQEDKGKGGHYEVFDKDFKRNVLEPFCRSFKKRHPEVTCGNTEKPESFNSFFENRRLHPAQSCSVVSQPTFGLNETDWTFIAPQAWGYAPGQDTFLYRRAADAMVWQREHEARVVDVNKNDCGSKKPGDNEVCVHVLVKNGFGLTDRVYDGVDCTEAKGRAEKTDALFGFSQDDASTTRGFIRTPEKL